MTTEKKPDPDYCNYCGKPLDFSGIYCSKECELNQEDMEAEYDPDESTFQHCADCDLPDACSDYGCAIENGIKRKNDGVF